MILLMMTFVLASLVLAIVSFSFRARRMGGIGFSCAFMGLCALGACTAADIAAQNAVFTDAQIACIALANASAVIPAGTPLATVGADVRAACGILASAEADIEAIEAAYIAGNPAPVGAPYKAPARK